MISLYLVVHEVGVVSSFFVFLNLAESSILLPESLCTRFHRKYLSV